MYTACSPFNSSHRVEGGAGLYKMVKGLHVMYTDVIYVCPNHLLLLIHNHTHTNTPAITFLFSLLTFPYTNILVTE